MVQNDIWKITKYSIENLQRECLTETSGNYAENNTSEVYF